MGLNKSGTDPRLGPDRLCVHTGPPGTGTMWSTYPGTIVGPLEERSKYGPGPVQVSCK